MEKWQERIVQERSELLYRLLKLNKFLENPENKLNLQEWNMLLDQYKGMQDYCRALTKRCKYYGLIECADLKCY